MTERLKAALLRRIGLPSPEPLLVCDCFRVPPFGSPRIRAVKKEKLYLWDRSAVAGSRLFYDLASHYLDLLDFLLLPPRPIIEAAEGWPSG